MSSNVHNSPLISVIIPAYNCGQYIAHAVRSVFDQTIDDHEIIVVNDGSPDTELLELELRAFGDTIEYLKQPNRGPSAARNAGIRLARGKYVAFLDGDDYWRPQHLAKLLALFVNQPDLVLTYCDCVLLRREKPFKRAFQVQPQANTVNFDSLLVEDCSMCTSTIMVLRDAVIAAGMFDEDLRRCEDFDLWLRIAFTGATMRYDASPEVHHRVNDSGLSSDSLSMKADRIRVYEKVLATFPVSKTQAETIRHIMTGIQAESQIEKMKSALAIGDYVAARAFAEQASGTYKSWKLALARSALRISPSMLRWVYLTRARMLGVAPPRDEASGNDSLRTSFSGDSRPTSTCIGNGPTAENRHSPVLK